MCFVQCSRHLSAVLSQDVEQGSSLVEQVLVPLDQALSHREPRNRDFCRLKSSLRVDSSTISFLLPPSPPTLELSPPPPFKKKSDAGASIQEPCLGEGMGQRRARQGVELAVTSTSAHTDGRGWNSAPSSPSPSIVVDGYKKDSKNAVAVWSLAHRSEVEGEQREGARGKG